MQSYKEILLQKFSEAYQQLNPQQQQAVDTIDGPVMVIAGPGTGKTQILAARIGKILLDTDAAPENILCLTYTDAGTIAMRKRLLQFIGADAYKTNISTFHAFCNDVIQENLYLFEKNSLDPISELESIQLFKDLIDGFSKDNPLKRYRGDVYFEINNLRLLFSNMKREGWSPEFIAEKIDAYLDSLPTRDEFIAKRATKEFKKGDVRIDKIAEETQRMDKLRAAVHEFDRFQLLMKKRNRYDFDDMINWVIRAFEDHPDILLRYQEQFQYVLVDEYQDTSGTQNKLVQQLIGYWSKPNVFVVGDDDQSIYRFQGANVENMVEFAGTFSKDLVTVVLTSNYRSTQPILDVSKVLIEKNTERLVNQIEGLSKNLVAANTRINQLKEAPVVQVYQSVKEEMAGITLQVSKLLQDGIAPGRIAVIYKENSYGEELARYFRLKELPVYSKRNINILENPFIRKLILLLRYLNAEMDIPYGGDEMLFEILHFDWFQIPPIEIARITVAVNEKKYKGEATSIRKMLSDRTNAPAKDLFDTGLHEGLKKASRTLETLIGYVPNVTLLALFEKIINDESQRHNSSIVAYVLNHPDKLQLLQLLTALFDFIKSETSRNPLLNLEQLVGIIELMEKEGLPLPMLQVAGTDKGVNLLTAHGSKGLEFEHVFVAGVQAGSWEKKRKPGGGYKLPDTIFGSQPASSDEEELRRLLFVALTRAEQHLNISHARFKNDGKEMEPSMFLAEITQQYALPEQVVEMSAEDMADFALLQFTAQAPEIEAAEQDFITGLLDKFVMNVTALSSYLQCPLGFYYKNLIRIPSGKSEATEFGSAIHHALEKLFRNMQEGRQNQFPPKSFLLHEFEVYMKRHREHFTKEAFERRMEYGEEVLTHYYDQYLHTWNPIVAVEQNIRGVVVNHVPLKGKLDKLEFNGKEVNVVDYKSGDIDKALPKLRPPHDKDPNGGDYWRQAVFYKILVDHYPGKDWKVVSTEFDFVEPDKNKVYRKEKIIIQPADIETVKQQIVMVWEKIQQRDFYTGCGKEDCHWCNFVKDHQLAVALHDLEEEAEETN